MEIIKHYLLTRYCKHSNISNNLYKKNNQKGGSNKFFVEFNNFTYNFIQSEIDDDIYILYAIDSDDVCVLIEVNKKTQIAHIQNINGINKSCVHNSDQVGIIGNNKTGTTLLQITLKLLNKLKKKLNIKCITLNDESYKLCLKNNKKIDMKIMQVLRTGDTWYGKYGFRPIEIDSNFNVVIDTYNNTIYENNKIKMNTYTISNVNILYFFSKQKFNKLQMEGIQKIINKYPNMLVKDFINKFLNDYDNNCVIFYNFYKQLFDYLGLEKHSSVLFGKLETS